MTACMHVCMCEVTHTHIHTIGCLKYIWSCIHPYRRSMFVENSRFMCVCGHGRRRITKTKAKLRTWARYRTASAKIKSETKTKHPKNVECAGMADGKLLSISFIWHLGSLCYNVLCSTNKTGTAAATLPAAPSTRKTVPAEKR